MTTALAYAVRQCASTDDAPLWSDAQRRQWASAILEPAKSYPDQWALVQALSSGRSSVAANGTRRSGKTDGIMRWAAAACTVRDHFTVRIFTQTLHAPTLNFFRRKSDGGLLAILRDVGLIGSSAKDSICRIRTAGNPPSIVSIEWPWGSSITVEDIGSPRAVGNKHGGSADVNWIDEVTKTPMASFAIANLIAPTLADSGGIVVLSYTPDENLDSLPAMIAAGEDTGYESHWFRAWRNPHFGATFDARWQRLCDGIQKARADYMLSHDDMERLRALSEQQLDAIAKDAPPPEIAEWANGLNPQLLINWFGRWLRIAGTYVYYPFHTLPSDMLYYCANSEKHATRTDGPALPVATTWAERIALLPGWEYVQPIEWQAVIAVDIGHDPSAYAEVVKLWALHYPTIYELHSYKEHRLEDSAMFDRLCDLVTRVGELTINGRPVPISRIVADLTGMMVPVQKGWNTRLRRRYPTLAAVGVRAPKKPPLIARRRAHCLDLAHGRMRYIAGNPVAVESTYLQYRTDKPAEIDLTREIRIAGQKPFAPRNDALTAAMYADLECKNINPTPPPGARKRIVSHFHEQ